MLIRAFLSYHTATTGKNGSISTMRKIAFSEALQNDMKIYLWRFVPDLVPFAQFKKHEKQPQSSVTFSKACS